MKLNLKIPYIQVKRPIKINKYHLKRLQDTYSKITVKEPHKSKAQINKKDIKLLVICSEIPHTQIPDHVTTSQLNFYKIQITSFRKTQDNRTRNLRTDSRNKVNKNELQ